LTWEEGTGDDVKIVFTLEAEGPGTAYASDLKSTDEKIMVHSGGVPIIKLGEGQKLRLEATAIKGVAKTHAKFQCALAGYGLVEEKGKKKGEEAKFFVESYNNVPAVEQLQKALEMVKEKTEKLKKEFK
jgi:DNA-directed RNA polymerase alpha subunit